MYETIVINRDELGQLAMLSYFDRFSRFDEFGKIGILSSALRKYVGDEPPNLTKDEDAFCEGLKKSVGTAGIWALLSTAEGSGTGTWKRGFNIIHMVKETDRILNGAKEYKGKDIPLVHSPEQYYQLREDFD